MRKNGGVHKTFITCIIFCRDPNGAVPNASASEAKNAQQKVKDVEEAGAPFYWDTYDTINQLYLELGEENTRTFTFNFQLHEFRICILKYCSSVHGINFNSIKKPLFSE